MVAVSRYRHRLSTACNPAAPGRLMMIVGGCLRLGNGPQRDHGHLQRVFVAPAAFPCLERRPDQRRACVVARRDGPRGTVC